MDAPLPPARGLKGEVSVGRVCGVLHNADGPLNTMSIVDVMDVWASSSCGLTSCLHNPLQGLVVRGPAIAMPVGDAAG